MTVNFQATKIYAHARNDLSEPFEFGPYASANIVDVDTLIHDLSNQIQCAASAVELLRRRVRTAGMDEVTALARSARLALRGADDIAGRLYSDDQHGSEPAEMLDIQEILHGLAPMLRVAAGEQILVTCRADVQEYRLQCGVRGLEAAILNLVLNARDALEKGGHIAITANLVLSAPTDHTRLTDAQICLAVQDNGEGMPECIRDSACEPYVSTKGTGPTRGLGLASVKSFVEENGGWLMIDSEPGRGTAVQLFLPAAIA